MMSDVFSDKGDPCWFVEDHSVPKDTQHRGMQAFKLLGLLENGKLQEIITDKIAIIYGVSDDNPPHYTGDYLPVDYEHLRDDEKESSYNEAEALAEKANLEFYKELAAEWSDQIIEEIK